MKRHFFSPLFLLCIGCTEFGVPVPPDIPIQTLLAAPESVRVDEATLTLSTALWRDFMPMTDPDGTKLIAVMYIETTDSVELNELITADAIWIVRDQEVWKGFFTDERPSESGLFPRRITRIARNGPQWDGAVDVIVRLLDTNGTSYLLRAPHQSIGRTY